MCASSSHVTNHSIYTSLLQMSLSVTQLTEHQKSWLNHQKGALWEMWVSCSKKFVECVELGGGFSGCAVSVCTYFNVFVPRVPPILHCQMIWSTYCPTTWSPFTAKIRYIRCNSTCSCLKVVPSLPSSYFPFVFPEGGRRRQDWRDQVLRHRARLSLPVLPVLRQAAAPPVPAAPGGHPLHQPDLWRGAAHRVQSVRREHQI